MENYLPDPVPQPPHKPFKLECVIVCADYSDFLAETLPHNKQLFDRVVVVTSKEDVKTQKLCEYLHVQCIPTYSLNTLEKQFCKGAGINDGLKALNMDGWVLHLDADIYLPPQTRILLERASLDETMLYGADRFNVVGFENWRKFMSAPVLLHENESWIHLNAFPMGTRVYSDTGYVPIGFFQLWNPKGSGIKEYPQGHTTAAREDGLFALLWPRAKRHLLAEIVCYHLESEKADKGTNWSGRQTKPFTLSD